MSSTYSSAMRHQKHAGDATEGVPAPPRNASTTVASSTVPSRDSVSAAIALVRAKQAAKAGKHHTVHKVNNLDELRMLRVSNKITTAQQHLLQQQQKHRSLQQKRQQHHQSSAPQSENATPKPSVHSPKITLETATEERRTPLSPVSAQDKKPAPTHHQQKQRPPNDVSETLFSMVNDVFSSRSETRGAASTRRPIRRTIDSFDPFDQPEIGNLAIGRKSTVRMAQVARMRTVPSRATSKEEMISTAPALADSTSTITAHSLPSMPSMKSADEDDKHHQQKPSKKTGYEPSGFSRSMSENDDNDADGESDEDLPEVDAKTMADVNAFLDKLGVHPSASKDNSVTDSIEKMRMMSSSVSADDSSSIGEVEPETMAEISAFIDNISRKDQESVVQRLAAEEQRLAREAQEKKRQAELAVEAASKAFKELDRKEKETTKRHLGDAPSTVFEEKVDEPVEVKNIASDDSAEAEVQVRTSRPSPIYELMEASQHGSRRDPPSTLPYEGPVHKADPPGPPTPPSPASMSDTELSQAVMQMHQEGEEIIAPSYSVESLDSSPPASVSLQEEKKSEDDEDDMGDEEYSQFVDTSFAANVRKTLSTVVEAASVDEQTVEAPMQIKDVIHLEDFQEDETANYDNLLLEALGTSDEASPRHSVATASVESPRHSVNESSVDMPSCSIEVALENQSEEESLFGDDGRREPKGEYDHDQFDLEEVHHEDDLMNRVLTPESEDLVPERYESLEQDNEDNLQKDLEHYESLEQDEEDNLQKELEQLSQQLQEYTIDVDETESEIESSVAESGISEGITSEAQSEDDSAAWALRDIASEETMRATGRTRHRFVVSGRRPSKTSRRNIASLLSDDTSVQPSEVLSEAFVGLKEVKEEESFSSDDESEIEVEAKPSVPDQSKTVDVEEIEDVEEHGDHCGDNIETYKSEVEEEEDAEQHDGDGSDNDDETRTAKQTEAVANVPDVVEPEHHGDDDDDDEEEEEEEEIEDPHKNFETEKRGIVDAVYKSPPTDLDEVQVLDEGVEITASCSLIGQEEESQRDREEQETEHVESEYESSECDGESEQAESESVSSGCDSELHLGRDPSGHLGRSVEDKGNEVKKPDPEALEPEAPEKHQRLEIDNKTIIIEEQDDEVNGTRVIHILTDPSGLGVSSDKSTDVSDGVEEPAFEVGQGPLSPTRLTKFVSNVERHTIRGNDHAEQVKHFKRLIVPLVDGHKPTLVESAHIRQAALRAGIDLNIVDEFLDYVDGDETPDVSPTVSSVDEQELLIRSFEVEDVNEDEAIAGFLARVEQARLAAAEAVAAAAAKAIEAAETEAARAIDVANAKAGAETDATVIDDASESEGLETIPSKTSNTFLKQFEDLKLDEGIEAVGSDSCVHVLASPTTENIKSSPTEVRKAQSLQIETRIETPAFEVGQGLLSPTRLSEFLAIVDQQYNGEGEPEEMEHFKSLIVPIVDGHNPSAVEVAQIRQAAFKANVPLNFVDNFLDYVNDQDGDAEDEVNFAASSIDAERSMSLGSLDSIEDHNDDQAIAAFLARVEKARVEAEEAAIALEAEAEAALQAKATLVAQSALEATSPCSKSFIKSFEELEIEEEDPHAVVEKQLVESNEGSALRVSPIEGPLSPTKLSAYFAEIDQHRTEKVDDVKTFQKLMLPVANGHKPSVIEEARIRQAAIKAYVPLDLVDMLIGYVKNDHPEIVTSASSKDPSLILKSWDDVEDVNEDEAIAGFLSRFHSQKEAAKIHAAASESNVDEKAISPIEIIDAISKDLPTEMTASLPNEASSGIGDRSSNAPSTDQVKSGDEEEEPWWKHAGSPKTANPTSFASPSEEWGGKQQSTDIDDAMSDSKPRVVEVSTKQMDLSVDTDLSGSKNKTVQKFDENVWRRRTAMATYGWGWEEATWLSPRSAGKGPVGIDGVTAVEGLSNFMFNKDSFAFARRNLKLSYKQRTKGHPGYFDVHVNSLLESATFGEGHWPKDDTPWELRYVRQRFLHERSLTFSRNWFGSLEKVNGNDKIKAPVCKPKSMEMPMENIPEDGEWDVEWYTTWSARKNMPKPPPGTSTETTEGEETTYESEYGSEEGSEETGSYTDASTYVEDDEDWEDAPECGTLVNVKQKIGERVTRVHPDYTSSLRRSRWRKKYFPKGSFPY